MDVSFSCIFPVNDHEICHNIVKVGVDLRGDSQVDSQTTNCPLSLVATLHKL